MTNAMTEPTIFTLKPFEMTAETANLALTATVKRHQNRLSISYCLSGDLASVVLPVEIPTEGKSAQRKDRLWEQTCFEFFLGTGRDGKAFQENRNLPYWEFNLSPTRDWNVFALQGYRQGLTEAAAFSHLPFTLRTSADALHLDLSVDIEPLIEAAQSWRLGISAVLLLRSQQESFWAIAHPAAEADFHHPDSFVVELEP